MKRAGMRWPTEDVGTYYLTDPETGRRNPWPEDMPREEASYRNECFETDGTRHRWMKDEGSE